MFSPKVLDRANTIEFRVKTGDLPTDLDEMIPLGDIAVADPAHTRVLLDVATDGHWHSKNRPSWLAAFAEELRTLHEILTRHGFEFGHRVFAEALRFASIHHAMAPSGDSDHWRALDLQVMQKMLPRMHGARRRLEPALRELGSYAFHGGVRDGAKTFDPESKEPEAARLQTAFDKIRRMTQKVRANQFASFAE